MNTLKYFLITGTLISLQSCFVTRDYERPKMTDSTYFRTDQLPQDHLNMAKVSWREFFTDSILISHIEKGLENNLDIRIAIEQMLAAEAYMKQGKAGYFPSFSTGANVNHQILSKNSQFGTFFDGSLTQFDITGSLSWEADIWGKIRSADRASRAAYLQRFAAHKAVKSQLVATIASTYYQLLSLDEQKRITLRTIENRERSLETTRALKEAGNVTEVGVKQTEAQFYTARILLIDLDNEIKLLENRFSILLGENPKQVTRSEFSQQKISTELSTGIPADLLANRPDVMAAEYQLINAFELTNVVKSNFYPSLSLSATGGFQSLELRELLSANSLFANLAGSLLQPVFNKRQIRTEYEASQARQQEALLSFEQALLTAGKEVSDAMFNYQASRRKIEMLSREYQAYEMASAYSEELLNNGYANYLEVLTARENMLNSRLNLIHAKFREFQAVVDIYRALGGGWQ